MHWHINWVNNLIFSYLNVVGLVLAFSEEEKRDLLALYEKCEEKRTQNYRYYRATMCLP